ncbi:MAG: hypothetical protein FGF51_06605 [Candidatus Brockarchaeota archaeon]|nr:hypothetical protein [Candidatus Brockarchaeota archaeon]
MGSRSLTKLRVGGRHLLKPRISKEMKILISREFLDEITSIKITGVDAQG